MEGSEGDGIVTGRQPKPGETLRGQSRHDDAEASGPGGATLSRGSWRTWVLVLGVFVVPILLTAAIPAVAAPSIPSGRKVAFSAALVIAAEGTFLIPALVFGGEAVRRYRSYLDPLTWFGRTGNS